MAIPEGEEYTGHFKKVPFSHSRKEFQSTVQHLAEFNHSFYIKNAQGRMVSPQYGSYETARDSTLYYRKNEYRPILHREDLAKIKAEEQAKRQMEREGVIKKLRGFAARGERATATHIPTGVTVSVEPPKLASQQPAKSDFKAEEFKTKKPNLAMASMTEKAQAKPAVLKPRKGESVADWLGRRSAGVEKKVKALEFEKKEIEGGKIRIAFAVQKDKDVRARTIALNKRVEEFNKGARVAEREARQLNLKIDYYNTAMVPAREMFNIRSSSGTGTGTVVSAMLGDKPSESKAEEVKPVEKMDRVGKRLKVDYGKLMVSPVAAGGGLAEIKIPTGKPEDRMREIRKEISGIDVRALGKEDTAEFRLKPLAAGWEKLTAPELGGEFDIKRVKDVVVPGKELLSKSEAEATPSDIEVVSKEKAKKVSELSKEFRALQVQGINPVSVALPTLAGAGIGFVTGGPIGAGVGAFGGAVAGVTGEIASDLIYVETGEPFLAASAGIVAGVAAGSVASYGLGRYLTGVKATSGRIAFDEVPKSLGFEDDFAQYYRVRPRGGAVLTKLRYGKKVPTTVRAGPSFDVKVAKHWWDISPADDMFLLGKELETKAMAKYPQFFDLSDDFARAASKSEKFAPLYTKATGQYMGKGFEQIGVTKPFGVGEASGQTMKGGMAAYKGKYFDVTTPKQVPLTDFVDDGIWHHYSKYAFYDKTLSADEMMGFLEKAEGFHLFESAKGHPIKIPIRGGMVRPEAAQGTAWIDNTGWNIALRGDLPKTKLGSLLKFGDISGTKSNVLKHEIIHHLGSGDDFLASEQFARAAEKSVKGFRIVGVDFADDVAKATGKPIRYKGFEDFESWTTPLKKVSGSVDDLMGSHYYEATGRAAVGRSRDIHTVSRYGSTVRAKVVGVKGFVKTVKDSTSNVSASKGLNQVFQKEIQALEAAKGAAGKAIERVVSVKVSEQAFKGLTSSGKYAVAGSAVALGIGAGVEKLDRATRIDVFPISRQARAEFPKLGIGAGLKSEMKGIAIQKEKLLSEQKLKEKLKVGRAQVEPIAESSLGKIATVAITIPQTKPGAISMEEEILALKELPLEGIEQVPRLKVGELEMSRVVSPVIAPPPPPPPILVPPPPPPSIWMPPPGKKRRQAVAAKPAKRKGFDAELKVGGKFRKVSKEPLEFSAADALGAFMADENAARTYRVRKSKSKKPVSRKRVPASRRSRKKKFYPKKGATHTFVEKTAFAIDSPGEKKQITNKGLAALRSRFWRGTRSKRSKKKKGKRSSKRKWLF